MACLKLAARAAAPSNGTPWNGHHFKGHLEKHHELTRPEALNKRQANVLALTLKCESKMAGTVVPQWKEKLLEQAELERAQKDENCRPEGDQRPLRLLRSINLLVVHAVRRVSAKPVYPLVACPFAQTGSRPEGAPFSVAIT